MVSDNFQVGIATSDANADLSAADGVVEFNAHKEMISLEEKPVAPKSSYAVPEPYFYDGQVCDLVKQIKPSSRCELEITDLNRLYLVRNQLQMELFSRGTAWLDMGTNESLQQSSVNVKSLQEIQGFQIANLEEIALRKGWISTKALVASLSDKGNSTYNSYLRQILNDPGHYNPHFS